MRPIKSRLNFSEEYFLCNIQGCCYFPIDTKGQNGHGKILLELKNLIVVMLGNFGKEREFAGIGNLAGIEIGWVYYLPGHTGLFIIIFPYSTVSSFLPPHSGMKIDGFEGSIFIPL